MTRILHTYAWLFVFGVEAQGFAQSQATSTAEIPLKGYKLVWSDEFHGRWLDTKKWGHRALGPRRDAVNSEECATLDGRGHLLLTTQRKGGKYLTAMISTEGKFETTYGYFECRAKLQRELGHWSAFWLQSPTIGKEIGKPQTSGVEVDIFEYLQKDGDTIRHNLHWDGYRDHHKHTGGRGKVPGLSKGWHTFGVHWTKDEYVFYVDNKATWRAKKPISQRSQYIILSLEVGPWAGDIAKAKLPDSLVVDHVRVYQKK